MNYLLGYIIGFALGLTLGIRGEIKDMQREAVQHSAAHWVTDKDGNAAFAWGAK